jgi:hypothetical protein
MVKDLRGREIEVGDLWAHSFAQGSSSAYIRIGKVTEVIPAKDASGAPSYRSARGPKIRVQWFYGGGGYGIPDKPTLINTPRAGIVLPPDFPLTKEQ